MWFVPWSVQVFVHVSLASCEIRGGRGRKGGREAGTVVDWIGDWDMIDLTHLQLLVKSKTNLEEHSCRVASGQRHMHLLGSHTRPVS